MLPSSAKSAAVPEAEGPPTRVASACQRLLDELLGRSLVLRDDWEALSTTIMDDTRNLPDPEHLLRRLVELKLLTEYQADRIRGGKMVGLFFGNYRVLDRLGTGGMGVVYLAEHILLRRHVALKVLPNPFDEDLQLLSRFLAEIRSVARLRHPNIVAALDADRTRGSDLEPAGSYYLVMEYVPGEDLEQLVRKHGPLPVTKACDFACQIASALAETHQHGLIHRDIKPSNIRITPDGQAKLLDFGLARRIAERHTTDPGTVLGTLDYMAPEQAGTATSVDHRADLYALGGVLYWCLSGKPPFPRVPSFTEQLLARQSQMPPLLCEQRPELPKELDEVLARLMALRPEDRYQTARAVIGALLPFLARSSSAIHVPASVSTPMKEAALDSQVVRAHRVLIVDDVATVRVLFRRVLEREGLVCEEAVDGRLAVEAVREKPFDLVLLDINIPEVSGREVLQQLRDLPPCPNLKVIMLSADVSADEMAQLLATGADDFLPKPISAVQLTARVKAALALKDAQDRSDLLNRHLLEVNAELEHSLRASTSELIESRNSLLLALAELAELRIDLPSSHLVRFQRLTRLLAEEAAGHPAFAGQIDANYINMLEWSAPLHDIGMAALPDYILRKVSKFEPEERLIMQSHTTIGANILQRIARQHRSALILLRTAADIARSHHEAYDGSGYPDRLAGAAIPLAARLVALPDVYEALRSRRPHRPALAHHFAVEFICEGMAGHFDPHLLQIFRGLAPKFHRIVHDEPDDRAG